MIVYYHGGGWVLGTVDQFDALGRRLAARTGCAVVLVDYRLAPEHRYPAAVEDAWTALEWTAAHLEEIAGDSVPLIVAGDSAGGCLAAVVAQRAREVGPEIALQVLVYPVTDCDLDRGSYLEPENQLIVGRDTMTWFWDLYAPDPAVRSRPDASPLRAASLAGLPPAVVLTAQYDPLRDEGEAYAERLAQEGVRVEHRHFDDQMHTFFMLGDALPGSAEGLDFVVDAIDRELRTVRRDRRRRRIRRPLRAAPSAGRRPARPRARAGRRRRRHLVLEPLSRRPLRHRERGLLVLVLRGARAGVGVERALPRPARDPALPQPRRRPLRPAPRHRAEHARGRRRATTTSAPLACHHGGRSATSARYCVMACGSLSAPHRPAIAGLDDFAGEWHHTARWPARAASTSPASASASSAPARPASSRSRSSPSRPRTSTCSSARANFSMPAHNRPLDPDVQRAIKADYRERRRLARESLSGVPSSHPDALPQRSALEVAPEERARPTSALGARRDRRDHARVQRHHHERRGERHGRRVRPRQDPRDRPRPGDRGRAVPDDATRSAPSASASTPTTTRRTTAPT